jgi:hypothetical protein
MSDLTPRWSGLNPASSPVTVESGLPMLRELRLSNLTISKPYSIAQLTQLSGLTLLALFDVTLASAVGAAGKPTASQALNNAVPALLEHLPRLEHLDLNYLLSELTANAVAATSSSLTRLSVSPSGQSTHGQPLAREPPISVVQLVQLQHLDVRHAVLDPAALANLLQLRRLHMQHCRLAPGAQSASVAAATGDQAILLLQSVGGMHCMLAAPAAPELNQRRPAGQPPWLGFCSNSAPQAISAYCLQPVDEFGGLGRYGCAAAACSCAVHVSSWQASGETERACTGK